MTESNSQIRYFALLAGFVALSAGALAGCGVDDPPPPCEGVICQFGTCSNDADGQCVNRETCRGDTDCIPGYLCGADNTCEPETSCATDNDCEQGVCGSDEVCVNPNSCDENAECVARTFCGEDGECRPDPCNETSCDRGVCERGTGACVSAESCSPDTQVLDCVAGEKCVGGSCEPQETYCETMTCERGTCSFEEEACVNAGECSEDSECIQGYFCNDSNQCRRNLCEYNNVECPGEPCEPATGECPTPDACETNDDCVDNPNHLCIEGTCRLESTVCGDSGGDGGCPGNRICEYDADTLTASCIEPESCETSIDCDDGRRCNGQTCLEADSCDNDIYEPNEDADGAVDFEAFAEDNAVAGTVCPDDTDVFRFATTEFVAESYEGTIQIDVTVPERDIGLGEIQARLLDGAGSELSTATLPEHDESGHLELSMALTSDDHGEYMVEVSAGGSTQTPGLGYELSVNMLEESVGEACEQAEVVELGQQVSGTTEDAASSEMGSSCTSDRNEAGEKIFRLDLDQPREVNVEVTPQFSEADLAVSLRRRCEEPATETACSSEVGRAETETVERVLGAGSHYIVVQAADGATGGAFQLTVDDSFSTRCAPGDDYCDADGDARKCTADGGSYEVSSCGDAGCNVSTGECRPPENDTCLGAKQISGDTNESLTLGDYSNTYQFDAPGCLGDEDLEDTKTDGPDRTYAVEVPAQTEMSVVVTFPEGVEGATYLSSECRRDVTETCVAGARGTEYEFAANKEQLVYINETGQAETYFLVVDVGGDEDYEAADTQGTFEFTSQQTGGDTGVDAGTGTGVGDTGLDAGGG